jgi:hypothetical protein
MQTPSVKALSLLGCLDRPLENFHNGPSLDARTILACFFLERSAVVATGVIMTDDCFPQSHQGGGDAITGVECSP